MPEIVSTAGEPLHAMYESVSETHHNRGHRFARLILELRQRKVCRAAMAYAIITWVIFQIAEVVFEALGLPEWSLTLVVVIGILGFPITVLLTWTFEITPNGLVIDAPRATRETSSSSKIGSSALD